MLSNLQVCFNAVMPLFLIMGLGYGVKCLGGIRVEDVPGLNKMAFRFFMPVMLFWNLYTSSIDQALQPKLLLFAVGATLGMYGLSLAIVLPTEKDYEKQGVKIQGMYRSNLAIIGLPLATVLAPGADMGPVAMLAAIIVPLFNVLAVITLTAFRGERLPAGRLIKMVATNPLILGSAVGLVFLGTGWRLPTALESAVHQVAAMTSPFMLFLLGAFFRFSGLRRYRRDLIEVCLVRLFLMPALLLTAAFLIGIRGVGFAGLISVFASATAIASFTMTQQMGRAGAEIGDGAGVQQRPGRAGVYIEQQRGAVQGGQVFGGVIAEPGHHLHAVKPQAIHMAGLDMQGRRTGGELVERHGPQGRTAGALFQIGLLHGPNRHGDGQQRLDGRAVQYRQFCHGLFLLITMCRQRRPRPPGRPAGSACHRRSRYAYCGAARSSRRG